ncbi:MAG: M48 family metalloprotease [Chloroflexota bacterium]
MPSPSRREQAAELAATRRRLFLVTSAVGLLAPWALWASGLSGGLWASLQALPTWLALPIQLGLLTLVVALISTPLSFYGGHVIGHRYGLSTQTVGGWLVDWLKGTLLLLILSTAAASLFYVTLWWLPSVWGLAFWLEALAAVVVLTFLAPYVFVPLFFKPQPVDDPGMVLMIEDLVRQAGTTVAGVSRLDFSRRTHEANAAVIGFGHSRRVVLADTLLESFTPSEIRAVVAHELGHHIHRDVMKLLVLQAVVMGVGLALAAAFADPLLRLLGAEPLTSPVSFPLVMLGISVYGLLGLPLVNGVARAIEAHADTYAFDLLGDGRPFAAAMRRLADQNLAEERPPRWAELMLYTHPAIWRRIARAEAAAHG